MASSTSEIVNINNISENGAGPSHFDMNGGVEDLSYKPKPIEENKPIEIIVQENNTSKDDRVSNTNNSTNKAKKRKKIMRDAKAPKQALTGYFRFLNNNREKVRNENPSMPFSEITKQLAAEWNVLPIDVKQPYLDAAEQDKERYNRELEDYKKTDAYKEFLEKQAAKKKKNAKKAKTENNSNTDKVETNNGENNISNEKTHKVEKNIANGKTPNDEMKGTDIPIFTDEFLEHNKACEAELRQLRKATTDYESQNAVLQRHVDSLNAAISQLDANTNHQKSNNVILQHYLDVLRSQLVACFSNIPLPDTQESATSQNIDSYIGRLDSLVSNNIDMLLRNALRTAVSRVDFIK